MSYRLTVLMPCLNEAETLAQCISAAQKFLSKVSFEGEVLVADNGSTDGSIEIAEGMGARVIRVREKGYGSALIFGISEANGEFIVMGDSDASYDFFDLDGFIQSLNEGSDLVMGNRFLGGIAPGAMPFLHRYLGNPVLSRLGRLLYGVNCSDFHCGLRAFRRASILSLNLKTKGMEFASEMVVKAALKGLKIDEVPTRLSPAGRSRPPHLRTWRDGWRHLRFLLCLSPRWLFLYPGASMIAIGVVLSLWLGLNARFFAGVRFDVHTLLAGMMLIVIGVQTVSFGVLTRLSAQKLGILPETRMIFLFRKFFSIEKGILLGLGFCLIGVLLFALLISHWVSVDYGALDSAKTLRLAIPSVGFLAIGVQTLFSSFVAHLLSSDST